ncbi:class I adenylate-forming enzyme family protein [Alteribacillus sp. JSM 102045]|uniref:class I adenylate-forming enzyme family protein n=1 Tax=Alteribacillus sp. JSM 102045 TaxID=1562101 RepID=UPI0035C209FB
METEKVTLFGRSGLQMFKNRPKTIADVLSQTTARHPEKEMVRLEDTAFTYQEADEHTDLLAAALQSRYGISKGDRVGVVIGNSMAFPLVVFACTKIGAIMVPLNVKLQPAEMEYILNDASPRLLISEKNYEEKWKSIPGIQSRMETFVIKDESDLLSSAGNRAGKPEVVSVQEEDPAYIIYTSGTTGRPKGAVLSHANVIHNLINYNERFETHSEIKTLIAVPLFHVTGLIGQFLHMVYTGGTSVILKAYQNDTYIEQIQCYNINFLFNVPAIFTMMRTSPLFEKYSFDFIEKVAYGGSPIYQETLDMLKTSFPNATYHNAYGATETASPATLMPVDYPDSKAASVGLPVTGAELKIVDGNGKACSLGEEGELLIKGPMVIEKYWNNSEANQKSFDEGFWRSGDIAAKDEDGFFYILDRKKDMINRAGEKIFSIEVEDVLKGHPAIQDAAVVGVPDPVLGEKVKAFLVPAELHSLDIEEVKTYCRQYLATYKTPEVFQSLKELPRNASGKILKHQLKSYENTQA